MFFWASKLFWVLAEPANLLVFAMLVGVIGILAAVAERAFDMPGLDRGDLVLF